MYSYFCDMCDESGCTSCSNGEDPSLDCVDESNTCSIFDEKCLICD